MIKNKNKNKTSRRIVLSTLAFSSLVGVGLSLGYMNGFNLQEENLVNNQEINKKIESVDNTNPRSLETALIKNPLATFENYYPFEIPIPALNTNVSANDPFWDFFAINGTIKPNVDSVTFKIESVNLFNSPLQGGTPGSIIVNAEISRWVNDGGIIVTTPRKLRIQVNNLKFVEGPTTIIANPTVKPITNVQYASDFSNPGDALTFLSPKNNITNSFDPNFASKFESSRSQPPTFDNSSGLLNVTGVIRNYINSNGTYIPTSSGNFFSDTISIRGFKPIPGPTKFESKQPLASSTTPSVLLRNADSSGVLSQNLQDQFFESLSNPLTFKDNTSDALIPSTVLIPNGFVIKDANDTEGTIKVELTVKGGYYGFDDQNRLIPVRPTVGDEPQKFTFTVGGFNKFVEKVDNTMTIVIAGIGGGVAFIAVIIALVFLVRFQKKKSEQIKKKKSMDDKLYAMSSKPKKGPEIANATAGIAPGGMAPGRPGGPQAPGKYVPPTISVPKSNAPVVKRPSGPTPPTPPIKK
ncbi:MAG: lipoprotein 17-related variable surface protein [Mycoplasmoidaceae bacterium]